MITDEMVEKATKAALEQFDGTWSDTIRAALAAVLPDIVEQCAFACMNTDQDETADITRGRQRAAKGIRALASLSFQDGKT